MLTERRIRDAKPEPKTRFLWDGQVKGLGVRITPAGVKAFVLFYRTAGRKRLATLARVSELSLDAARKRAGEELAAIRNDNHDPLESRRELREAPTVNDGLDRFFGDFVEERIATGRMKPSTVREYRLQATATVRPAIGKRRIEDIERADIEAMVRRLASRPVHRNRTLAFVSRLFNVFELWGWRRQQSNPARGVERAREQPRDRTLSQSEIAALGTALEAESERRPAAVAAIRIATMTGLRIGEVLAMKWADLDFEGGRVTLPDTKTGRRMQVLSTAALEAMNTLPKINDHVFTTGAGHVNYKTVRMTFLDVVAAAGLSDVRIHDLRRTLMTRAAAAGMSAHVLRDLLGHKTAAMADRYIRRTGGAVADATERMGGEMAAILAGKPKADVLPIRRNG